MTSSMTGYGRYNIDIFKIESRSINHRYLDIHIKVPTCLYYLEPQIRKVIKEIFVRGRIDVFISTEKELTSTIKVNIPFAQQIYNAVKTLQDTFSIDNAPTIEIFTLFREVFMFETPEFDQSIVIEGVRACLEELKKMRLSEGKILAMDMKERIELLKKYNAQIMAIADEHTAASRDKYAAKINELLKQDEVDEKRLMEEVAFQIEKSDIKEEVVRTEGHLAHMIETLNTEGPQGRRMDFLCQELIREINSIGSKVNSLEITSLVVEMKCELERLREQVQNIQ